MCIGERTSVFAHVHCIYSRTLYLQRHVFAHVHVYLRMFTCARATSLVSKSWNKTQKWHLDKKNESNISILHIKFLVNESCINYRLSKTDAHSLRMLFLYKKNPRVNITTYPLQIASDHRTPETQVGFNMRLLL